MTSGLSSIAVWRVRRKRLDSLLVLKYYQRMRPATAYRRLNKLLWRGRLPAATIQFVDAETLPGCYGITLFDDDFARPVILLNSSDKKWGKTLIHEAVHCAEPSLNHGVAFDILVETYWKIARKQIKGLK
jgi:hypothetical protein